MDENHFQLINYDFDIKNKWVIKNHASFIANIDSINQYVYYIDEKTNNLYRIGYSSIDNNDPFLIANIPQV